MSEKGFGCGLLLLVSYVLVLLSVVFFWIESMHLQLVICLNQWQLEKLQVQRLVEMGFAEAHVRSALEAVGGDENLALEKLCSG